MKNLRLLYVLLLLTISGCTSNTSTEGWTSLQPGTFDKLRDFVLDNGYDTGGGYMKYDFPNDMNSLMLETKNDTVPITVWSRLAGVPKDTVPSYLTMIMYHINPNDSWTEVIVDSTKYERAIRPIVDDMLAKIDD